MLFLYQSEEVTVFSILMKEQAVQGGYTPLIYMTLGKWNKYEKPPQIFIPKCRLKNKTKGKRGFTVPHHRPKVRLLFPPRISLSILCYYKRKFKLQLSQRVVAIKKKKKKSVKSKYTENRISNENNFKPCIISSQVTQENRKLQTFYYIFFVFKMIGFSMNHSCQFHVSQPYLGKYINLGHKIFLQDLKYQIG